MNEFLFKYGTAILFIGMIICMGLGCVQAFKNQETTTRTTIEVGPVDDTPPTIWYSMQNGEIKFYNDGLSIPLN